MQYDVSGQGNYVTLTDISRTVDINNLNEDKVSYYTYYNIQNGDRPDIISQKLYGNPNYYWTFFILNDQLKTGISNSWPLASADLENMISNEYDEYSAIVISPELTFQNRLAEGHGDFSVIPLDSQYLTSLKITDSNNMYKANILKYDYALLQLVVHNIVEISTGKTSSAIKNAFLNSEQYRLIWENAYEVTPVAASLLTGDSISANQILFTAIDTGTLGNNISIVFATPDDNALTISVVTNTVNGVNYVVITIKPNVSSRSASTIAAAVNADTNAKLKVKATLPTPGATGGIIAMAQTFLSGGIDNVPTDAAQLALYAADVANKEEFINRVITQYDKVGNRYVDNVDSNGLPTKSQYVFGKDYYRAITLSNSSWEYYKYAPYQYFKLDEFDSSVTYPESVFSILNTLSAASFAQGYSPYYLKVNGAEIPFFYYGNYATDIDTGMPIWCTCPTLTFVSDWLDFPTQGTGHEPWRPYPVWMLLFVHNNVSEKDGWTLYYIPESASQKPIWPNNTATNISNDDLQRNPLTVNPSTMAFIDGTQIFAKPAYTETIGNISYYEKEQLENDSKQKIKVVRTDLIRNFEKTYFSVLTS